MRRILVIGAGGRLEMALARAYAHELEVIGLTHCQLQLGDLAQIRATLDSLDLDLLINCAALTAVDYCETHRAEAFQINSEAPGLFAEICRRRGAEMVHFSTDYVFL